MATNSSSGRDRLEDEIKKLETVVTEVKKPTLPTVKLEETKYDAPTDAQLEKLAVGSLADYKTQGEAAIRKENADGGAALQAKRDAAASGLDSELTALDGEYSRAARGIDNDVIKRGLARSSIAATQKGELEADRAKSAAAIRESYGKRISELDSEISALGSKLQTALDDFNVSYAVKLNETLAGLKAERENKIAEAAKYNNEIRAKQAALDAERLRTESELYTAALKQQDAATDLDVLSKDKREVIYKEVFKKMDDYLASLSKEEAKREIRNHMLYRDHLSDIYFYKLYDKYGR